MSFVHLHVHSEYSLLDGFSNIPKLVARAKEMGMPALALTDHGTMFGVIDFYNAAVKAGIKPLIGVEAYLAPRGMKSRDPQTDKKSTHLLLLAENQTGYQNLLKITSAAQLDGFYYYPRVDHELVAAHAEGLICTSGCMSAEVPRLIQDGNLEGARKQLDWYYDVFGKRNFYLELQQHDIKELASINKNLLGLGPRYQSHYVATNDVHYINPEDARLQDILLAIQTGTLLSDPNRMRMTDASYYLRSPEEMGRLFAEVPEALDNTVQIAERCSVDLGFKGYHLPGFEVPPGTTVTSYLHELCEAGLKRCYGSRSDAPDVRQRLNYELGVIDKMGFDTYFLIVWDLCRYAREQGIWYNARGSAAGSIVAYTLEITMVDPLLHGLIFERFLNPGRISMPDIDLDFRDDRRAEMLEYTARKYGDDRVAQIITFGTLGARASIRDVGRVMDVPLSEVDRVAKLIPNVPGKAVSVEQALLDISELKQIYESTPYMRELIDTAKQMEGVVRNAGTHAAGVVISDKPIIEYVPLHRPTGNAAGESPVKTVTQFEMNVLDSLGMLKVDFLGLATLTIMARACDLIAARHGVQLNLNNIPTDDPATFEMLGRGETAGVFQFEGSGMRRYLIQMKPKELANAIAMVALFRPGPMDFIPGYIRRMHGEEAVEYRHPLLESIFKETFGFPVYQEQLMFAAMRLAGYDASEADDLRKAIAKKIKDKLQKHRQKFIDGSVKNGLTQENAAAIFDDWEEFARYGFNKSHAVDYGVMAVEAAYLKVHYTVEYMTALLSVSKNDAAKVALYVADCRRMNIPVEAPDVNASDWDFAIEDCTDGSSVIRFGLGAVKNVGQGPVEAILKARQDGPFTGLNDFARRVDLRLVGKRALECLVKVGALGSFGARSALLEALDRMVAISTAHFRAAETGQLSLFGASTGVVDEITLSKKNQEAGQREVLNWERELLGLYVSDHPLNSVMQDLVEIVTHYAGQLSEVGPQEHVRVAGLITRLRNHQSKAGKPMAFVTIEDLQGAIELVIFPRVWEKVAEIAVIDRIVLVDGRVDAEGAEPKVLVDSMTTEFSKIASADAKPASPASPALPPRRAGNGSTQAAQTPAQPERQPARTAPAIEPEDEIVFDNPSGDNWENIPPEPEAPPDWDVTGLWMAEGHMPKQSQVDAAPPSIKKSDLQGISVQPAPAEASMPALSAKKEAVLEPNVSMPEEPALLPGAQALIRPSQLPSAPPVVPLVAPPNRQAGDLYAKDGLPGLQRYLVPPSPMAEPGGEVRMLTVVLRSTGDKTRDVLRLRRIHGIVTSYPGKDRFSVHVFERGKGFLLEFPNFTAGITPELVERLTALLGQENVRVEKITFQ